MKGLIVINGYPAGEKFLRQGARIQSALIALGVKTDLVKNGEIYAVEGEGSSRLFHGYDFAVYLDKDKYLGYALEGEGLRLFNRASAVENCDDKLRTYQALRNAGVQLIKSIPAPLCYTQGAKPSEVFLQSVAKELGFPLVAKKSYGSFGAGVQLVRGYAELLALEEEWLHTPHFYQRYIAEAAGRDIRALVIGGKVVAAMERVAASGEFRSNIELGGKGRAMEIPKACEEVAIRAATALRLDYCGVDLLLTNEGVAVCEVNSNAFFEGLEEATGVDVAAAYAAHIVAELSK